MMDVTQILTREEILRRLKMTESQRSVEDQLPPAAPPPSPVAASESSAHQPTQRPTLREVLKKELKPNPQPAPPLTTGSTVMLTVHRITSATSSARLTMNSVFMSHWRPLFLILTALTVVIWLRGRTGFILDLAPMDASAPFSPETSNIIRLVTRYSLYTTITIGGLLLCVAPLVMMFNAPRRARLRDAIVMFPVRHMPALLCIDVLAVLSVWVAASFLLCWKLRKSVIFLDRGDAVAIALLANSLAMVIAVAAGVYLARARAGPNGSRGFWPFWQLREGQSRPIWHDIGLGLAGFAVFYFLRAVAYVIHPAHVPGGIEANDGHFILLQLHKEGNPATLTVYFLMATAGAAVMEEMLFRGVLYNALRRAIGANNGALLSAAIFAALHGLHPGFLNLFLLAILLTFLYDKTGRLVASITMHTVSNLVTLLLVMLR